jgi:hypothetical protein
MHPNGVSAQVASGVQMRPMPPIGVAIAPADPLADLAAWINGLQ